jgi:predicted nucleic acid-binding protein
MPLPIHVDDISIQAVWDRGMRLARDFGLTMYDASYVELAGRRSLPLATLDSQMRSVCRRAGVDLVAEKAAE